MKKQTCVEKLVSQSSHRFLSGGLVAALLLAMSVTQAKGASRIQKRAHQPTLRQFKQAITKQNQKSHLIINDRNSTSAHLYDTTNPMMAAATVFSQTQNMTYKGKTEDSAFSGSVGVSYGQSMVDHLDGSKQAFRSLNTRLGWTLSENYSISGSFSVDQNLRDGEVKEGNGISDIGIGLAHKPWDLANWLTGSIAVTTVIPASEQSTRVLGLQTALGIGYTFALTPAVLAKGFETSLTLGASRNFHRYETSVDGRVLNPYGLKEVLSSSYTYNKAVSFSFEFIHRHAWSYGGNVTESFEHSQELGYIVAPNWSVSIGHTNSGSWLKANTQDSNLKLINEDDSVVYLTTSVMF